MVVKMMKWRPWPPLTSKKFEAKIAVRSLEGLCVSPEKRPEIEEFGRLAVEIRWKGSKGSGLSYLRRNVKRNCTKEENMRENGVVEWNEEFRSICSLLACKEGSFHPWKVKFTVFSGLNQGPINKIPAIATALLNLAEFASSTEEKDFEISIPLSVHGDSMKGSPSLCLSLSFLELTTAQEPLVTVQMCLPLSPCPADALSIEKHEVSALKAGLRKVKVFTSYVSARKAKAFREEESSDGRSSVRSEDAEYNYPFDTDSPDDLNEVELEEGNGDSSGRKSVCYGSLAYANFAGALFYSTAINSEDEDLVYYSNRRSDVGCLHVEDLTASAPDQSWLSSKRSILPWKRRKLSFRSPKAKGEPLLKKDYQGQGGDDIDFDRRQLSSSDESSFGWPNSEEDSTANRSSFSEFGDDNFAVGSWENKEVASRDGHMKLQTKVFFASIDQRSERAAGESACTALVAVIADWFQSNHDQMPIKSQLDSLIREGSLEWRNLCEIASYRKQFPDKHFDLETVLQAKIRPLCVVPEKSFIGFFHPEGLEEVKGFDFLRGAMSFDSIWDEISKCGPGNASNGDPLVYIVSWNDHFFVLKVEQDAYYIIDTLGERLFEGCNQAYILKFDEDTTIQYLPKESPESSDDKPASEKVQPENPKEASSEGTTEIVLSKESEESVVCRGKESCKEYIKRFLAAIPIGELQGDLKKGLMASTPLHQRLQIEFHYTRYLQPVPQYSSTETTGNAAGVCIDSCLGEGGC